MSKEGERFSICLCCGSVIERTEGMKRFVQCLECQRRGNQKLLELSKFRGEFDKMMIEEGMINQ